MGTKIKAKNNTYDISQEVPEGARDWLKRLYLVATAQHRLVGIIEDETPEETIKVRSLTMYGALMYICNLSFQPMIRTDDTGRPVNKEGKPLVGNEAPEIIGVRGGAQIQLLTKYDIMFTPAIRLTDVQYVISISDMEPDQAKFFVDEFLRVYDPPRIIR